MNWKQCPICHGELSVIDVAPCFDCGHTEDEIAHFNQGKHTYSVYSVFGLNITLCNICWLEFENYDSEYFGLSPETKLSIKNMNYLQDSNKGIEKDKFCPSCGRRLSFLKFLYEARKTNSKE